MLWALLLVPLAMAAYAALGRRGTRAVARFTNPALLPNLAPRSPGWRRHVPAVFYLVALAGLLISLARPQAVMAVPREQATLVLVMDTSISMVATDVQPNRFAAANTAAKRFLDGLPTAYRVALVSFSANAQLVTAPTADRATVRAALDSLRPEGGTAMGDALELARGVVQSVADAEKIPDAEEIPAAILLLSDGAQTAGQAQPLDVAGRISDLGVPVYTIALGTQTGVIDSPDNPGTPFPVPPDEGTLRQIARLTDGQFFSAPSASDLQAVYDNIGSRVGVVHEPREITSAFAAAGALLLALGSAFALIFFNRFP
jgi:Ca-activated chloride channel family protein